MKFFELIKRNFINFLKRVSFIRKKNDWIIKEISDIYKKTKGRVVYQVINYKINNLSAKWNDMADVSKVVPNILVAVSTPLYQRLHQNFHPLEQSTSWYGYDVLKLSWMWWICLSDKIIRVVMAFFILFLIYL